MNIAEALSVRIPCTVCGEFYEVPLTDILLSYRMLEQACQVPDETECPPLFQARLIPREVLHNFVKAWQRLEKSVDRDNGELVLSDCIERNGRRSSLTSGTTSRRGVEKCSCRPWRAARETGEGSRLGSDPNRHVPVQRRFVLHTQPCSGIRGLAVIPDR